MLMFFKCEVLGWDMIVLDGREGGGQMVRSALALSMITGEPFRIKNIRASRNNSGLKAQHLAAINCLRAISKSRALDAELGSSTLEFFPSPINRFRYDLNIGTAGSITLVLQALLLPLAFADKKSIITITGGTDVAWSMPIDYLTNVLLPILKPMLDCEIALEKRGYFPEGGGKITLVVKPLLRRSNFSSTKDFLESCRALDIPIDLLNRKKLIAIEGISHASKALESQNVAERNVHSAQLSLASVAFARIRTDYANVRSIGAGISLWAICGSEGETRLGSDSLDKGSETGRIGQEAAEKLIALFGTNAVVDEHTADNLVPWLALFGGSIRTNSITQHIRTNAEVVAAFLQKINVENSVIRS